MRKLTDDTFALHLFSEAQEGIAVYDSAGALVAWNAAARAITGWDRDAAETKDLRNMGAGMIQIRDGKWVDLRRSAVTTSTGELSLLLFNDATSQVALREARRQLTDGGLIDRVTSLAGPDIAHGHLERSIALAKRDGRAVGALSIGIDVPKFAERVEADELLTQVSKRVIASTRTSDLAARVGDWELLIVLTAMVQPGDAAIVAVRLLLHLSQTYVLQGRERSATISIGVASFPTDAGTAEVVAERARDAMRGAQVEGGGYRVAAVTP